MRLHTRTHKLERSGVSAEQEFSIKATAKSFEILSSGLYTDPKLALVRELSCNAYDAHVAAGKADEPFKIHLPNDLEPWLSIIDNGTGLCDEDVMTLYTTYFDSTKTHSNDFIGALGLGSKSPFSYTDTFEVVSRFEGKKRMYTVFLNEHGVPTIARLAEIDTDECNGIEVKIAISPNDFYNFKEKVKQALKYFPVKPTVVGDSYFEFNEFPTHRLEGEGWFVAPKGWSDHPFTAVQGNVAYRVDINKIYDDLTREEIKFFDRAHVVAFFEIGDLEVAASREEIRYDDRSRENLLKAIRKIRVNLTEVIEKKADEYKKSFWEACVNLDLYSHDLFGNGWAIRSFVAKPKSKVLKKYVDTQGRVNVIELHGHIIAMYSHPRWATAERFSRGQLGATIAPHKDIVVFKDDVSVGSVSRISKYAREHKFRNVLLIRQKKERDMDFSACPNNWSFEKEYKALIKSLGKPTVLVVSEETTRDKKSGYPVYVYNGQKTGRYHGQDRVVWKRVDEEDDFDFADGGLYFLLKKGTRIMADDKRQVQWAYSSVKTNFNTMRELVNEHFGYDFEVVYGVSSLAMNKVKKTKGWYNIFDLFRKLIPDYEEAATYGTKAENTSSHLNIKNFLSNVDFTTRVRDLNKDSPFKTAVLPMIEEFERVKHVNGVASFVQNFDAEYGDKILTRVDSKPYFTANDFESYPMLRFVGSIRSGQESLKALFDYIQLVDRS